MCTQPPTGFVTGTAAGLEATMKLAAELSVPGAVFMSADWMTLEGATEPAPDGEVFGTIDALPAFAPAHEVTTAHRSDSAPKKRPFRGMKWTVVTPCRKPATPDGY